MNQQRVAPVELQDPAAIISVYNKANVVHFASGLLAQGIPIISSGGTATALRDGRVRCFEVKDITEFKECLGGRLKTIHPKVAGGILADRSNAKHMEEVQELGIPLINVVSVNLYPFEQKVASGATHAEIIENIDIGGVLLLRAAAKNYQSGVMAVSDPADYDQALEVLREGNKQSPFYLEMAIKAFELTAAYDKAIHSYLDSCSA